MPTPMEKAALLRDKARLLEAKANVLREKVLLRENDVHMQDALDRFETEEMKAKQNYLNSKALTLYGKARIIEGA